MTAIENILRKKVENTKEQQNKWQKQLRKNEDEIVGTKRKIAEYTGLVLGEQKVIQQLKQALKSSRAAAEYSEVASKVRKATLLRQYWEDRLEKEMLKSRAERAMGQAVSSHTVVVNSGNDD